MALNLKEGLKKEQSRYFKNWYAENKESLKLKRRDKRQTAEYKENEKKRRARAKWENFIPPETLSVDEKQLLNNLANEKIIYTVELEKDEVVMVDCVPLKSMLRELDIQYQTYLYWQKCGFIYDIALRKGTANYIPVEVFKIFISNYTYKNFPYKKIENWVFLKRVKKAEKKYLKQANKVGIFFSALPEEN